MSTNGSRPPGSIDDLLADLVLLYGHEPAAHGVNGQNGGGVQERQRVPRQDDTRNRISSTVHGLALIAAYEAALAVASEVRVEPVLQRIVDLSRTVVPAKYAALGIVGPEKTFTQLFVSGMSEEEVHRLGALPTGHGLLGAVLEDDEPVIIDDILSHPGRVGFPPNHPVMSTLIGVPIRFNGEVLGNLYLAEPVGEDRFTEEDIVALRILADHAAAAIDRARLYRTVEQGQRNAENQLSQLRDILNALPAGVFVMGTPDAHVNLANTTAIEAILGADAPPDAVPVVFRDFDWLSVDGVPLPRSMHPGMLALRGEPVGNRQLTLVTKAGGHLPVLVQSAALQNHEGETVGAVVVFQDVTRQRAAEQVKDDFLSLISHEFRTPLTAIHGGAHLLATQGDAIDDETRKELLDDIVIESARLDRMLANLLRVSEIMAGRFQANTEPMIVAPMLQSVIDDFRRRTPGFTFTLSVPADVPLAEGDPELLRQILRNLYENAIKYSPNGGTIHTQATRDGQWVSIRVQDQGSGIAPEHVQTVFERFRRPGADPTVRGMGLGLYLSQLLVEAQGGKIHAVSEGIGKGATFIVDLPVERGWQTHESRMPGSTT
jgi:K+-sensing histidine kinase KdpD